MDQPASLQFRLVGPTQYRVWFDWLEADSPETLGQRAEAIVEAGPAHLTWYLQVWSDEHRCWCDGVTGNGIRGNVAHPVTVKWSRSGYWRGTWQCLELGLRMAHLAVHDEELPPDPRGVPHAWIRGG